MDNASIGTRLKFLARRSWKDKECQMVGRNMGGSLKIEFHRPKGDAEPSWELRPGGQRHVPRTKTLDELDGVWL